MSRDLNSGLRIVSIGGGTGLSTLLAGLKTHAGQDAMTGKTPLPWIETLTAVVTVTDDGGSSGRLREEFQILPPGDIRNCMVALAEDERLLTKLFQYRFESDGDLSGHSFGNIFLAALTGVTGDFLVALKLTSEVLAIKGRIFPSTTEDVSLLAELEDGRTVAGETRIVEARSRIKRIWLSRKNCRPLPETLEAIEHADIITIGPGSLYTSIIPNLLVHGIVDAIRSSKAIKVYICNVMTQPGETEGFRVEDHIRALYDCRPDLPLDYVIVNSAPISPSLRGKYLAEGAVQVEPGPGLVMDGLTRIIEGKSHPTAPIDFGIVTGDLINENDVVRHDPAKLARLLLEIYQAELDSLNGPALQGHIR
jgi:uncharacterized cofD-like protein